MIKIKSNPSHNHYSLDYLQSVSLEKVDYQFQELINLIDWWTSGYSMKTNKISSVEENQWLDLQEVLKPYFPKENRIIYRSVAKLDKNDHGYWCTTEISNSYVETALKSLQNWTYSKEFASDWASSFNNNIVVIFKANTKKNKECLVYDPKSLNIYLTKINNKFPKIYNKYIKKIKFLLKYLYQTEELLLYSKTGEIFIDSIVDVKGCVKSEYYS